jgi:RNA polymerase sigma factor (sigma-70 family)
MRGDFLKDLTCSRISVSMTASMTKKSESSAHTRASLLVRLKDHEDAASWGEFHERYHRLLLAVARQAGLTPEEAEDAAQETLAAVAKHIGAFHYDRKRCSFKSWLMLIARQRIIWQVRKRPPGPAHAWKASSRDETPRTPTVERVPDPQSLDLDATWEREWERGIYEAALTSVRGKVNERQFQIFDLLVAQNWTVAQVVKTFQVSRTQVYLAKHRVTGVLKKELRRLRVGE